MCSVCVVFFLGGSYLACVGLVLVTLAGLAASGQIRWNRGMYKDLAENWPWHLLSSAGLGPGFLQGHPLADLALVMLLAGDHLLQVPELLVGPNHPPIS